MSKKNKHVVATVMQQMTDILNREPIELLLYGTDNQGQSYFIQTCGVTDSEGSIHGCYSLGENFSKEEALSLVQMLSQAFELPMILAH